jgi:predicted RNase H-like HicB family nuclease
VALVSKDGETIAQLLERLDAALGKVMADNSVIDEVLPEIKRRQSEQD